MDETGKEKGEGYQPTTHDLTVVRATKGQDWILQLINPPGDGNPKVVKVQGWVRCLLCEATVQDDLFCWPCKEAVRLVRAANFTEVLGKLLAILTDRPYILQLFGQMTDEVIGEYLFNRIRPN